MTLPTVISDGDRGHDAHHAALHTRYNSDLANICDPQYGASTSSADNSVAIQAALDAVSLSGGGTVFVPSGTFVVGAGLTLHDNTHLRGSGTLKAKDATNIVLITILGSNVRITDICIDGNQVNQTLTSSRTLRIDGDAAQRDHIWLDRLEIKNSRDIGVVAAGVNLVTDLRITNCYIHDIGGAALELDNVQGLVFQGNYVTAWGVVTAANSGLFEAGATSHWNVEGNTFVNTVAVGHFCIELLSTSHVSTTISSNVCSAGGISTSLTDSTISDNTLIDGDGSILCGIELNGTRTTVTGNNISNGPIAGVGSFMTISNNTLRNSSANGNGLELANLTDSVVSGNCVQITHATTPGNAINVGIYGSVGSINRVAVINNVLVSVATAGAGIDVQTAAGSGNILISGNIVRGFQYGLLTSADANTGFVTVTNNELRGLSTPISHGSTGSGWVFRNNRTGTVPSVASAGTITLPPSDSDFYVVSGTTTITSVTAGYEGQRAMLRFSGVLTFTDGSNLKLAGNLVTAADTTIALVCDGTNWYETGRSVN